MSFLFDSESRRVRPFVRSLAACAILAISFAVAHILESYASGNSALVLICATIVCSLYFGFWIGMGTAVIAALGQDFFFQYPKHTFVVYYVEDGIQLAAFILLATYASYVGSYGELKTQGRRSQPRSRRPVGHCSSRYEKPAERDPVGNALA